MRNAIAAKSEPDPMVLPDIVAQHAMETAFLWHLRDAAVSSRSYGLEDLHRLDDRVEAHVDGLRIAGGFGLEMCRAALASPGAGEVFAATVLAVERADVGAFAEILARGVGRPALARGIVSGLGWAPLGRARRFLEELLAGDAPPELNYFGIAGFAVHRCDPGAPLVGAAGASHQRLRARALRAIGELGRADLLTALRREIGSDDEACRFWAAWSAALLGEPAAGAALWRFALDGGGFAARACSVAVRRMDPDVARARLSELADTTGDPRAALAGAAALGDPALVPWVIDCMESPEQARFAGWAFVMISGGDLIANKLSGQPPQGFRPPLTDDPNDLNTTPDPDERLPWPDVAAVRAWWERRERGFPPRRRVLLGKPIDLAWLWQVLRSGSQSARTAAAMEICLMRRGRPLFEVRAPEFRQSRILSEMN